MQIKRFNEFVNESQEFELDYDNLDEGLIDIVKGALTKPNYKDPKTAKDFGEMVNVVADRFSVKKIGTDNIAKAPILISSKLINLLTMFLNKKGPFVGRTGPSVSNPVPYLNKEGEFKTGSAGSKPKPVVSAKPVTGAKQSGGSAEGSSKLKPMKMAKSTKPQ